MTFNSDFRREAGPDPDTETRPASWRPRSAAPMARLLLGLGVLLVLAAALAFGA